jgi:hypothetical protein
MLSPCRIPFRPAALSRAGPLQTCSHITLRPVVCQ